MSVRFFCPACGEYVGDECIDIAPGVELKCLDCGAVYKLDYKIVSQPKEEIEEK